MRKSFTVAAVAALAAAFAGAPAALAQQSQAPAAQAPAKQKSGQPTVRTVNIVDMSELPEQARPQVEAAAAKASEADVQGLREAIDRSPEIKKALEQKGATSAQVVVANLDNEGTLTLITKRRG
ncbi:hypothetical protein [Hansschlegelia zhihuaiae]|uniref:Uncharacterized protein n=1 Tax=Hansschlegelia zhihuaiae TaxID=405005 RepID=A0A4Q0M3C5_9HYPH|nr:hypothetical protein [Hansschlegelia zhihuaiae]RXF67418.1 hypothetical protein EK403_21315 [Hansschlegelia zhihuaiae]